MRLFAVAIALLVAACAGGGERGSASPSRAIPATTAPFASPTPTSTLGPALERVDGTYVYGGSDVDHPAGIYAAPDFAFPFTAELNRDLGVRDSDQEGDGFVYIGQDKNAPINGDEEFVAMLLRQVFDPADQRSVSPFRGDAFDWFLAHPRLTLVDGSTVKVTIDGLTARQADFLPSRPVACGPSHFSLQCVLIGYGPTGDEPLAVFDGSRQRVVVVDHGDRQIVFEYQHADTAEWSDAVSVFDHWVRSVDFK
jgi:hypothetical protein